MDNEVFVIQQLTGHMHYGSPFETDSDCGNCDGARCDSCHTFWRSFNTDKSFVNKEDAVKCEEEFLTLAE